MRRRPIKRILPFLLASLISATAITVPVETAEAAPTQGCISSNFQPNNCATQLTYTAINNISVTVGQVGTATQTIACTPTTTNGVPNVTLNTVNASNGLDPITGIGGMTFTYTAGTPNTATLTGTTNAPVLQTRLVLLAVCNDNTQLAYDFNVTVLSNATFTVTFSDAASIATPNAITQGSANASITLPGGYTRNGYTFDGWSATNGGTTAVANTYTPVANITLYAIWTAIPQVQNTPELDRKVTICHRTHAINNPYVRITVDYNSVNKEKGHKGHNDSFQGKGVYTAGIYKRAKDKLWGDIIPPDNAAINAGVTPRWQPLNWSTEGRAIYDGTVAGCPSKFDAKAYYNALRESGVPVKDIKKEIEELEAEQAAANPTIEKTKVENLKYDGTNTKVLEEENDKVTICHRTNSVTNPYRRITVAASSIYKKSGHYGHDEIYDGNEVFDSTVNYPTNRKDWGDIIPADPTGKNRWKALNWTTLGQAIYNGTVAGCEEIDNQEFYNELREEGKTKKEIKADLEAQKNIDDDPKDIDEIKYTGDDPEVKKSEPKEPTLPPGQSLVDQSLSGIVWLDLNRDGIKDPLEPFMKGISLTVVQVTSAQSETSAGSIQEDAFRTSSSVDGVRVLNNQFKAAATVVVQTDENGFYIFPSLGAGDWKVTTAVPPQLGVTYDSEGGPEGEVVTTVPVASHAFTWVGLVGDDPKLNETIEKAIEEAGKEGTVTISPNGTVTITKGSIVTTISPSGKVVTIDTDDPQLAATGSYDLLLLMLGMLMTATGASALIWDRRRSARTKL